MQQAPLLSTMEERTKAAPVAGHVGSQQMAPPAHCRPTEMMHALQGSALQGQAGCWPEGTGPSRRARDQVPMHIASWPSKRRAK